PSPRACYGTRAVRGRCAPRAAGRPRAARSTPPAQSTGISDPDAETDDTPSVASRRALRDAGLFGSGGHFWQLTAAPQRPSAWSGGRAPFATVAAPRARAAAPAAVPAS